MSETTNVERERDLYKSIVDEAVETAPASIADIRERTQVMGLTDFERGILAGRWIVAREIADRLKALKDDTP